MDITLGEPRASLPFGKSNLIWPFWLGWVDKQVGFLAGFLAVDCLNNKRHSDKHVRHLISRFWRHPTFWPKTESASTQRKQKWSHIAVILIHFEDGYGLRLSQSRSWVAIAIIPAIYLSIYQSINLSIYECIWVCPTCTAQPSYSSSKRTLFRNAHIQRHPFVQYTMYINSFICRRDIYIYIYIIIYIYIHTYMTYIHIHIYIYVYIYTHVHTSTCTLMDMWLFLHTFQRTYAVRITVRRCTFCVFGPVIRQEELRKAEQGDGFWVFQGEFQGFCKKNMDESTVNHPRILIFRVFGPSNLVSRPSKTVSWNQLKGEPTLLIS